MEHTGGRISASGMQSIYEQIKTPYKHGAVIKWDGYLVDSPIVFRHGDFFYMTFVRIDASCQDGYHTFLARSKNGEKPLDFEVQCEILTDRGAWGGSQTGGYAEMQDVTFGGTNRLLPVGGTYRFGYIGGEKPGYETDPLSMGLCEASDLTDPRTYRKFPRPVLSGSDPDARRGERLTIYKPHMFYDEKQTLGHPYVCVYNAKGGSRSENSESIFLAVSDDGNVWKRYGDAAIIPVDECPPDVGINGDPQIVLIDGHYVMLYFVLEGAHAYNTFAVSDDLIHWTKWEGQPLIKPEYPWEDVHAHKQWVIRDGGIVFCWYCAVNSAGERFIALATSEEI